MTSTIDRDERRELIRAGVEMALYIALSLLAVIVAVPLAVEKTDAVAIAGTLVVTAIGLLAAHWLAFRVSARLETGGILSREALAELAAQVGGGAIAVAIAVVPLLVLPPSQAVFASQLALLALIAGVAYWRSPASSPESATRARLHGCGCVRSGSCRRPA